MEKQFVTVDGNTAAADTAYAFTEVATIYPITPSSPMATLTDQWSARGRRNMFGQTVKLMEMQSEAGAIGAVHGSLQSGALTTTYTSSQGLLLMIPTLYRIAGEQLPAVLHVAARTVGTHGMSIFGDQSDVMACRQTGLALLCSAGVQEAADLAAVAHLSAVKAHIPFIHFFDGFRTSHELNRIERPDIERLTALMDRDELAAFRARALNPEHPMLRNTVQNGDVYFQIREATNPRYAAIPGIVEAYMEQVGEITGRQYHLFDYYGDPEADRVVIAMGSVAGTAEETVRYLNKRGEKTGFISVHLYRPFSAAHLLRALPKTVRRIAVLDRCKEPGSAGEPLYEDVCAVLKTAGMTAEVFGGRYGLSSKDVDPGQIAAAFENLKAPQPKNGFTLGITDDLTFLSLPSLPLKGTGNADEFACKFWGLGGDGTVGANHNTVKILGDRAGFYAQAYFEYDAKKSFGTTKSHLRFSHSPIRSSYFVKDADFAACHNQSFLKLYDIAEEVKEGGKLLLNCTYTKDELTGALPAKMKRVIAGKKLHLYIINATAIADRLKLGSHTNTVLQAAFFRLSGLMDSAEALESMKEAVRATYFAKGDAVIAQNIAAIDAGAAEVWEADVPGEWLYAEDEPEPAREELPDAVKTLLLPINRQKGDDLTVKELLPYSDGLTDMGLTAYEKRGIAVYMPEWDAQKCLQCNRCALVCPHAVIRPYLVNEAEAENAPEGFVTVPAKGKANGLRYTLQISAFDCTGCMSCVNVCPGKALSPVPVRLTEKETEKWSYALSLSDKGDVFDPFTVKGSQFRQPLVEFSAACAGCGETPYAKLLTQLFGDRMYFINATGCSQAWGAPMPGIPYTRNKLGRGPAWTNSLFENNAELALGLCLGDRQQRLSEKARIEALAEKTGSEALKAACAEWLSSYDSFEGSRKAADALIPLLNDEGSPEAREAALYADRLSKKTFWMYGGDGWAYDIGFGGLDHVIASGENLNVFVIDTEVYSNTGGQSSKATPLGAVAQFASAGKRSRKKDLGAIMMTYGNVYVAQVAMGADMNQLVKVLKEAEAYDGPSVIIAYTPCSSHGLKGGMGQSQAEMKRAVDSGYWLLYHYDPRLERPLKLDSPAPKLPYGDFLAGENRYEVLKKTFPEAAETLFAEAAEDAGRRYRDYKARE